MSLHVAHEDEVETIDLRDRMGPEVPEPDAEAVVSWLRSSGGTLRDRTMKAIAADLIESCMQVT